MRVRERQVCLQRVERGGHDAEEVLRLFGFVDVLLFIIKNGVFVENRQRGRRGTAWLGRRGDGLGFAERESIAAKAGENALGKLVGGFALEHEAQFNHHVIAGEEKLAQIASHTAAIHVVIALQVWHWRGSLDQHVGTDRFLRDSSGFLPSFLSNRASFPPSFSSDSFLPRCEAAV